MSKTHSNFIAAVDYFDKTFLLLLATSGSVFIVSFATVISALFGVINACLSLVFSISNGIAKKLLKTTRTKQKYNTLL